MNQPLRALPLAVEPDDPQMLLIFRLSGERFALSVSCVHEILDPIPLTAVPLASAFAPALINVRGAVAPLIDIRHRLQMQPAQPSAEARIIVLELPVDGQAIRLALIADQVDEVFELDGKPLEPIPELGARWPDRYLLGVARHGGDLVVLLNTETLFAPDDLRSPLN